ncbi:MAG TPA: efflux transporter outer membrane subunit [Burkholderiaceae bacterium]|nr:efflux transporter outer membrane subunit [Burkholderiaceae bacterium]
MMMTKNFPLRMAVIAVAVATGGCATLSPTAVPAVPMPAQWHAPAAADAPAIEAGWWASYGSPDLVALVAAAIEGNPDLAIAIERVRQAEAQAAIAGASLFPVVSGGLSVSRRDGGSGAPASQAAAVTFNASYEVDVWGRIAASIHAAEAAARASGYDRHGVELMLVAGVASAYFQLQSIRERLEIARQNVAIAERVHQLVDARARHGAASGVDVARQRSAILSQQASIPPLELQQRQALAALAALIGRPPQDFDVAAHPIASIALPQVAPGLPADLLLRRPDLAAAEARLAAANANVVAARAALLPGIQLTGSAGLASTALSALAGAPGLATSIAASLLQPIFDGGRLRGQVAIGESRARELLESYRSAVLAALVDVENALNAIDRRAAQESLQQQARDEAEQALRLAEIRYREGSDALLSVLDAQRALFQAQDQLALARLARLQSSVDLYKALGGGWSA